MSESTINQQCNWLVMPSPDVCTFFAFSERHINLNQVMLIAMPMYDMLELYLHNSCGLSFSKNHNQHMARYIYKRAIFVPATDQEHQCSIEYCNPHARFTGSFKLSYHAQVIHAEPLSSRNMLPTTSRCQPFLTQLTSDDRESNPRCPILDKYCEGIGQILLTTLAKYCEDIGHILVKH